MSPRGRKPRTCACAAHWQAEIIFKPAGIPLRALTPTVLYHDELEAIRLCDAEGLTQAEAGDRMGVSRGTVQRLVASGRKKLAQTISEAGALVVRPLMPQGAPPAAGAS